VDDPSRRLIITCKYGEIGISRQTVWSNDFFMEIEPRFASITLRSRTLPFIG
jgi:hypothetical protein